MKLLNYESVIQFFFLFPGFSHFIQIFEAQFGGHNLLPQLINTLLDVQWKLLLSLAQLSTTLMNTPNCSIADREGLSAKNFAIGPALNFEVCRHISA